MSKMRRLPEKLISIITTNEDNKKIFHYDVEGASCNDIYVYTGWINRTRTLYLGVCGRWSLPSGKENTIAGRINIDTEIYEKWDYEVKNGILKITLFEKINPQPDFPRIENK